MKYLCLLFLTFLSLNFDCKTLALADESLCYYAKVTSSSTYFYNTCNEEDKLFEIPTSYFVLLTDDANEEFYSAKYGNCLGFVKKTEVTPMNGTPINPYANKYNFRITSMSGLPLLKKATFESEEILNIEFLEDNIFFYGNFQGQEFFPNSTDIWYYCSYTKNNKTEYGYVFSYYCDFINQVKANDEYFEEITGTLKFKIETISSSGLSDSVKALIILGVIIPVLIGCYFFITPRKKKDKPKIVRRHKDYYELNESDLN